MKISNQDSVQIAVPLLNEENKTVYIQLMPRARVTVSDTYRVDSNFLIDNQKIIVQ